MPEDRNAAELQLTPGKRDGKKALGSSSGTQRQSSPPTQPVSNAKAPVRGGSSKGKPKKQKYKVAGMEHNWGGRVSRAQNGSRATEREVLAWTSDDGLDPLPQRNHRPAYRKQRHVEPKIFSRDRYVRANFRFVVKSLSDSGAEPAAVTGETADLASRRASQMHTKASRGQEDAIIPQRPELSWLNVVQVIYPTSHPPACPICLVRPPLVCRIGRCGHMLCLACVERYFNIYSPEASTAGSASETGNVCRRCPICDSFMYLEDLKPARIWEVPDYRLQTELTFTLMARPQSLGREHISCIAMPKQGYSTKRSISTADPVILKYGHVVQESPDYAKDEVYGPELGALILEQSEDPVEILALELARHRVQGCIERLPELSRRHGNAEEPGPENGTSQAAPFSGHSEDTHSTVRTRLLYFYQAQDGQAIFPDSLDVRILRHHFGDFSNFPAELLVPVESTTQSHITVELLKRHKYLNHLPIGKEVVFAQVDLSGIVTQDTIAIFERELRYRRERRASKAHMEEVRFEEAQKDRFGVPIPEATYFHENDLDWVQSTTREWVDSAGGVASAPRNRRNYARATSSASDMSRTCAKKGDVVVEARGLEFEDEKAFPSIATGSAEAEPGPSSSRSSSVWGNGARTFATVLNHRR